MLDDVNLVGGIVMLALVIHTMEYTEWYYIGRLYIRKKRVITKDQKEIYAKNI